MDDLLTELEHHIKTLLQRCAHLENVTLNLQKSQSIHIHEKEVLLAKNKQAITEIKEIITRLKPTESTS